jgi:4-hydroxy-tetrahydrodipicolinate synthase
MSVGAKGVISVASNLMPKPVVNMVRAGMENDMARATALNEQLYSLFVDLFVEPNPVPVKTAMKDANLIETADVRRPLCAISYENYQLVSKTVKELEKKLQG